MLCLFSDRTPWHNVRAVDLEYFFELVNDVFEQCSLYLPSLIINKLDVHEVALPSIVFPAPLLALFGEFDLNSPIPSELWGQLGNGNASSLRIDDLIVLHPQVTFDDRVWDLNWNLMAIARWFLWLLFIHLLGEANLFLARVVHDWRWVPQNED